MTVPSTVSRNDYTGTGTTATYTFSYYILSSAHLLVTLTDTAGTSSTLVLGTNYTVSGVGSFSGGSITLTAGNLASGYKLTIRRVVPLIQGVDLRNAAGYYAETHESEFDYLTMAIQQLQDQLNRSLITSETDGSIGNLPSATLRANTFFAFDASGNPTVTNSVSPSSISVISLPLVIDTIAQLKALTVPTGAQTYLVRGYYAAGDGGGGFFRWNASDVAADNAGTIIQLNAGGTGRWNRIYEGAVSTRWFGAKGDGATDDRAAILAAATFAGISGEIVFTPGTYKVASNLTISSSVRFVVGAVISIPTAVTVTFSKAIFAGVQQIFSLAGTGAASLARGAVPVGYPEWWGAVVGGPDCLAAIQQCIAQCAITEFQDADYFTSAAITVARSHVTLRGKSNWFGSAGDGATRIVVSGGSANTLVLQGPSAVISNFIRDIRVQDLELTRSLVPVPVAAGSETTGPTGLWIQYCNNVYIERVRASEHQVGFSIQGTSQVHLKDCYSFRSLTGSGANLANDTFWGYWLNGLASIGSAGGNASSYFLDCGAGVGGSPALVTSRGFWMDHAFVDTFLIRPEVASIVTGIYISGTAGDSAALQKTGNVDLHIVDPIIDAFTSYGIAIENTSAWAAIDIKGGYAAPLGSGSPQAAIYVNNSSGMIHISQFQGVMWPGSTTAFGLFVNSSSGVVARGNMWLDSQRPVAFVSSSRCVCEDQIRNQAQTATEGAVYLSACSRMYIKPVVSANGTLFPKGVELNGAGNGTSEINCSSIDAAGITGGSANKLTINAVQIVATGLSGTNLVSGVMT